MAIIARSSITVSWQTDIVSVIWYYKLQASTAAKPAKPTAATPSGWTTTEPTYTEGSTNSLYVCQKTTYSDGTFEYSDVSLSSSYEAAKTAYNKSVAAEDTAKEASNTADSAQQTADSASSQASQNSEAIRVQGLSLEAFRDEIKLAVASLANSSQIFKGDPLEDYQSEEIPTLLNYPTFTDFFIWDVCRIDLYCSNYLLCGTNNYAAHEDEIVLHTTYNDFYQFRYDSTEQTYSWVQMTAAEVEQLSNKYSYISVDEDGVYIRSSKNNQSSELTISSDGITPSRIFCC